MLAPSVRGWENRLEAYYKTFAPYFEGRRKSVKQHDVICFIRDYHFTPAQVVTATGYSLDFIHDTIRRFAARCNVRLIQELKEINDVSTEHHATRRVTKRR